MWFGRPAAICLGLVVLVGCGSGDNPGAVGTRESQTEGLEVVIETVPIPDVLPPEVCFVGIHDYDVTLLGEGLPPGDSCAQLADRFFPRARHLPWSPAALNDPDATTECVLAHGSARILVARGDPDFQGPRFERAYELAERACDGLRADGWKDAPISDS